jgi:hypothetical protein
LKRSTTFFLVPYSDSVYKTPKTHIDLLLLKTATRAEKLLSNENSKEKREGFMVSPVLHVGLLQQEREGEGGTEEKAEAA